MDCTPVKIYECVIARSQFCGLTSGTEDFNLGKKDQRPIARAPSTGHNQSTMATAPILEMEIQAEEQSLAPPLPETIEETGLPTSVIEQLVMKLLYARGDMLGRDLSEALGLKFSLIEELIEFLKRQHFIQAKTSMGLGASTSLFTLTETGRNHARECLETNQYSGPAPVPLYQYTYIVRRQRRAEGWLTREALAAAYRRMVVTPQILAQIGPRSAPATPFSFTDSQATERPSSRKPWATSTIPAFTSRTRSNARARLFKYSTPCIISLFRTPRKNRYSHPNRTTIIAGLSAVVRSSSLAESLRSRCWI